MKPGLERFAQIAKKLLDNESGGSYLGNEF